MQLSHPAVPAGQVGTMLGVGLGDHVHSHSVFSVLAPPKDLQSQARMVFLPRAL